MLKELAKKAGRGIVGDNALLRSIIRNYFKRGKYITASVLALYTFPVSRLLKVTGIEFSVSADYYNELQNLLHIGRAEGYEFVRIGCDNDGGYVMLNDFAPGGIAYSFGIAGDVSWDKDIASRSCDVFMYDHTIDGLPEKNPRFHWSKLGISDGVTNDERLKTLEELISMNHHGNERNMILKMDVEGAEWGFFETVKPETLAQFSQITLELHDVISPAYSDRVLKALRKINNTHQLIHLHANNVGNYVTIGGKNFPNLLEVSYVLREKYKFSGACDVSLPIEIDMPNSPGWPEIPLGHWNRRAEFNGNIVHSSKYSVRTEE